MIKISSCVCYFFLRFDLNDLNKIIKYQKIIKKGAKMLSYFLHSFCVLLEAVL